MPATNSVSKLTVSRAVAAEMLSVDVQTVDRAIADRTLRASKIGRRVLIRVADITAMLDANPA
jgi:excisionase family DNA binding protein